MNYGKLQTFRMTTDSFNDDCVIFTLLIRLNILVYDGNPNIPIRVIGKC